MMSRPRRISAAAVRILVAFGACPLLGCSALPSTHVVAFGTPYYIDGPQQPGPPDGSLKRGDKVWVFHEKESYSHMFTEDGTFAWVWSPSLVTWRAYQKQEQQRKAPPKSGPRMQPN